ncbi:hypothetical protein HanPI659440_Chr08g0304491 [Helianthus annuus]|nr:hypothetical protein HanPI659440_Chr08g0304491 [Helianthus annuus]
MICILDCLYLTMKSTRSGTRVGSGYGSKQVRVKKGQLNKGLFWFGSKRVWVGTGSGQNGFRVGSVKKMFFSHNTTIMFCIYSSAKYQMLVTSNVLTEI